MICDWPSDTFNQWQLMMRFMRTHILQLVGVTDTDRQFVLEQITVALTC